MEDHYFCFLTCKKAFFYFILEGRLKTFIKKEWLNQLENTENNLGGVSSIYIEKSKILLAYLTQL